MNKKLKQQLKLAFEAPQPKRKQEFLEQIQKQTQEQKSSFRYLKIFGQRWIWATSFSIGLILISMFVKVPTIEFDSEPKQCPCHIWIYIDEKSITETKLYSYSKCITCGEIKTRIEIVSFSEEEFCFEEERSLSDIEIKLR